MIHGSCGRGRLFDGLWLPTNQISAFVYPTSGPRRNEGAVYGALYSRPGEEKYAVLDAYLPLVV